MNKEWFAEYLRQTMENVVTQRQALVAQPDRVTAATDMAILVEAETRLREAIVRTA